MNITKIKSKLTTRLLGQSIHFETSTDSTQKWAARSPPQYGDVYLADFQSIGRGRLDRHWESPAGKNILMTLVDEAPKDPSKTPQITLVAGVAFAKALKTFKLPVLLKWPNDLFVNKRKIGGILCESGEGFIRVGVGININASETDYSEELRPLLTSVLGELGEEISREEVVATCLNEYEIARQRFDSEGIDAIIAEWKLLGLPIGSKVTINEGQGARNALYQGITREGFLLVQIGDTVETIMAGDLKLV